MTKKLLLLREAPIGWDVERKAIRAAIVKNSAGSF